MGNMMKEFVKIIKGFGMLSLLCILMSTAAFSEAKTDTMINQTKTAVTSTNASENLTAPLNESKVINASSMINQTKTAVTSTNASENLTAPLNESKVIGSDNAVSLGISTGTSSNSWDDAIQSVIRTVEDTGQKVEAIVILKLNAKIGENNTTF